MVRGDDLTRRPAPAGDTGKMCERRHNSPPRSPGRGEAPQWTKLCGPKVLTQSARGCQVLVMRHAARQSPP